MWHLVLQYKLSRLLTIVIWTEDGTWGLISSLWHDGGHSFCGSGWAPVRGFLCLFWHVAHTKGLRMRFPTKPEEDEKRHSPWAVNREELVTVRERWRSERGGCWNEELRLVDPEARSASVRGWVRVPGSCEGISFGYTLVIATECQKRAKTSLFLHLGLTQVRACLSFFSFTLGYICYVFVKRVNCLQPEMRGTTRQSNGHELI